MAMMISWVMPVHPSHPYLENDPAPSFAPTICAFHLGFSLVPVHAAMYPDQRDGSNGSPRDWYESRFAVQFESQDGHVSIATDVDGVKTLTCGTLAVVISRPKLPARWWPSPSSSTT